MSTALQTIQRAYRLITVIDPDETLTATQANIGIQVMNDMMAVWTSNGVALSYTVIVLSTDTMTVPTYAFEGIAQNLACKLAPEFGVAIPDQLAKDAAASYTSILASVIQGSASNTALYLIYRAYRIAKTPLSTGSVQLGDAIQALNDMLARWESNGIALGWLPIAAVTDVLVLQADAREAVAYGLAERIAEQTTSPADPIIQQNAAKLYAMLLRDSLGTIRYAATTPHDTYGWNTAYGQV